jgi:uncharacterized membrane protein
MRNLAKKLFPQEDLKAIADAIGEAEKTTAGEIRVDIRQRRSWRERKLSIEAMARHDFHRLGMTATHQRTGILIFLLLQDKQFYILADDGIHSKVTGGTWEAIAKEISEHFSRQDFRQGIIHGVQRVGKVLSQYFPAAPGEAANELSNEVSVR